MFQLVLYNNNLSYLIPHSFALFPFVDPIFPLVSQPGLMISDCIFYTKRYFVRKKTDFREQTKTLPGTQQGRAHTFVNKKGSPKRLGSNFQLAMSGATDPINLPIFSFIQSGNLFAESEESKNIKISFIFLIPPIPILFSC